MLLASQWIPPRQVTSGRGYSDIGGDLSHAQNRAASVPADPSAYRPTLSKRERSLPDPFRARKSEFQNLEVGALGFRHFELENWETAMTTKCKWNYLYLSESK